jgi:F-type H+-transporting ATPase subunit b
VEAHGAHHASPGDLLYPVINFAIFAALMVRALRGPIREYFRARAERLRQALATGDRARRDAEAVRAQLMADLADLPSLRERIKADLRATAEREREQLLVQARIAADRIRKDAGLLDDQELATARRTLRRETVEQAVHEASALVRQALQASDQERFVREFIGSARTAS